MNPLGKMKRRRSEVPTTQAALEAIDQANDLLLPPIDVVSAVPRPDSVAKTWPEFELEERETEQSERSRAHEHDEAAERAGAVAAAKHLSRADAVIFSTKQEQFNKLATIFTLCIEQVAPLAERSLTASRVFIAGNVALFAGHAADLSAALIYHGSPIGLALMQASAAAVSTVAAGGVGKQLRSRQKRQRYEASVSGIKFNFPALTTVAPEADRTTTVGIISMLTAASVSIGIAGLWRALEGTETGLLYGALSLALAGGSFLLNWHHADPAADLLELQAQLNRRAERELARAATSPEGARSAELEAISRELESAGTARTNAIGAWMRALKYRMLSNNGAIVGHGVPPERIGRTPREGLS
jgi:hypothetical protein